MPLILKENTHLLHSSTDQLENFHFQDIFHCTTSDVRSLPSSLFCGLETNQKPSSWLGLGPFIRPRCGLQPAFPMSCDLLPLLLFWIVTYGVFLDTNLRQILVPCAPSEIKDFPHIWVVANLTVDGNYSTFGSKLVCPPSPLSPPSRTCDQIFCLWRNSE
jgi:hypothetical protein